MATSYLTSIYIILLFIFQLNCFPDKTFYQSKDQIRLQLVKSETSEYILKPGQNITFKCQAQVLHGFPNESQVALKRAWSKDGLWLGPTGSKQSMSISRYLFENGSKYDQAPGLVLTNLTSEESGIYLCFVWAVSEQGTVASTNYSMQYQLKIMPSTESTHIHEEEDEDDVESEEEEPFVYHIESLPLETLISYNNSFILENVMNGQVAELKCPFRSNSSTTKYQWFKNATHRLRGKYRENGEKMVNHKWSLEMQNVVKDDSGNYTCVVSSPQGRFLYTYGLQWIDSQQSLPVFVSSGYHMNQSLLEGGNVTFDCEYKSSLQTQFAWFRFYNNSNFTKINSKAVKLHLANVSQSDSGNYVCLIQNSHGKIRRSYNLNVLSELHLAPGRDHPLKGFMLPLYIVLSCILLGLFALNYLCFRQKQATKSITVVAQKSFIIRKKIVLENQMLDQSDSEISGDFEKRIDLTFLTPLVKIDYEPVQIESNSGGSLPANSAAEYEIPLDKEWEMDRNKLVIGKKLGEGEFGLVVKGELNDSSAKSEVAIKMLKECHSDDEIINLVSEMEVMKRIGRHKNIINLIGCCTQNGPLYVVVEYAPHGNLRDFLRDFLRKSRDEMISMKHNPLRVHYVPEMSVMNKNKSNECLTFIDLLNFGHQIARGMEYLASKRCVHRDLAARNVLVCEGNVLKIADFGLARKIQGDYYRKTTNGRLPIKWMAIESLEKQVYTTQSDVWSFGILLWEIMTLGRTPYPGVLVSEAGELCRCLINGYRMEKPSNCSVELYQLMLKCWAEPPSQRPSFTQLSTELEKMITVCHNKKRNYLDINYNSIETLSLDDEEVGSKFKGEIHVGSNVYNLPRANPQAINDELHLARMDPNQHYINGTALRESLLQAQQPLTPTKWSAIDATNKIVHNRAYVNGTSNTIVNKCYMLEANQALNVCDLKQNSI